MAGHSYGEYVALCVAGAFSEQDLLRLSAERGRIVHDSTHSAPGAMAAVMADGPATAKALAVARLGDLPANLNSPDQTIIAGPVAEIEAAVEEAFGRRTAGEKNSGHRRVSHAGHGRGRRQDCRVRSTRSIFQPLRLPVWSNTTAAPYPADAAEPRASS